MKKEATDKKENLNDKEKKIKKSTYSKKKKIKKKYTKWYSLRSIYF